MNNSKIEWTDHTFNPWHGCVKVSAGCKNCYAEVMDNRWKGGHWGPGSTRRAMSEEYWQKPLKWNAAAAKAGVPAKVFCASMTDVFELHPDTSSHQQRLFTLIERTPHLIWQLLTKRPQNIMQMVPDHWKKSFPTNVWVGTSVENQLAAGTRIPYLLQVPAVVRFLSCEPLIGAVELSYWIGPIHIDQLASECGFFDCSSSINNGYCCNHPDQEEKEHGYGKCFDFSCPIASRLEPSEPLDRPIYKAFGLDGTEYDMLMKHDKGIHWVIAGGESGHVARPMHPDWVRSLRDQCQAADVPFFFKQWGEWGTRYIDLPTREPFFKMYRDYTHFTCKDWVNKGDACISIDGRLCKIGQDFQECTYPVAIMQRVGKKLAGRLLDGKEWNQFPAMP